MEDFVSFEQAKALKKIGLDCEVHQHYLINAIGDIILWFDEEGSNEFNYSDDGRFSAPTLAQAQKWLREVKEICVTSGIKIHKGKYKFNWSITLFKEGRCIWDESVIYDTYEQALSAGINKALELLK